MDLVKYELEKEEPKNQAVVSIQQIDASEFPTVKLYMSIKDKTTGNVIENLDDAFDIIEAFVKNRMGTDEGEEPIGLICDNVLVGSTSANYSIDPIFDLFGAHPRKWQICSDGEIV